MKTNILTLLFLFVASLHVTAQETEHSSVYIQTKDGLCLTNQDIEEELALIRFLDPKPEIQSNKWYLDTLDNQCIVLHNNTFAADNVDDCFHEFFQNRNFLLEFGYCSCFLMSVKFKLLYFSIFRKITQRSFF